ncbi:BZ3500-MvSof-1268-A1-R1-Chr3-1g06135 protein [Mycena venus]|uniref:BZ3500-MvSof-1268-A1-R1-Chr3-1g06135 protein n=1 Tax=Mycena venus TaxID=2733690 RepID=A0A8H7D3V5_9AGAR|nr:BZ3500-MvSof-1268-A1-R1-Chr3-1g06135 protein [Mycena venus]
MSSSVTVPFRPSSLTEYARLVSPAGQESAFAASPSLPPLSQFGYLSSSLALSAEPHAQEAVIQFLKDCRIHGFPVDGLYLSSGWYEETGDRNYFVWNRSRYPSPADLGRIVEKELGVQLIVNIKPWLLAAHPRYNTALERRAFVRPAPDAAEAGALAANSWVWAAGFASHKPGSYYDYSSRAGCDFWGEQIRTELLANGLTGMWIDNNEISGLKDDEERFAGEVGVFGSEGGNVETRMGWGGGEISVGSVGKAVQTMGMARTTYETVLAARPEHRPVIVSRSGVPGIQAYAHATWSGDNSTTWKALEWGTKMTLSVGMSFGPGLYGHDIGGFAGVHHPSPELLVRWCQNGAWHTRFTVHSWKEVSTTLWMYDDVPGISDAIRVALVFRYRLAPTFYSLYVTDYQRHGWPVLKPLLWHHSVDPVTLQLDEEFLFGSHVLVAPVTRKGATTRLVYLPAQANDGETALQWCELDTGVWHTGKGEYVELDAPLERTPALVRAGAIIILGGTCERNIYDGVASRTALVFPAPTGESRGSFTLIEDDGVSNDHTDKGVYTELVVSFAATEGEVFVDYEVVHSAYKLPYEVIWFELPVGDKRQLVVKGGKTERHPSVQTDLAAPSTRLSLLSNRIKSRLAMRRLYFPSKTACVDKSRKTEEESDNEDRSSDSESSSDASPPKTCHRYSEAYKFMIELLDLPLEIIENIADKIRDPKCPLLMDAAAFYISDKYSDFSEARFSLSALSKVCSELRCAVERILYRNIQLDFTGWKGRKHTGWPAGSLRLLLRTLGERPELGRYIHIAALDFQLSSTDSEVLEKGLEEFLMRTPNLSHLFLSQCPVAFWDLPAKHLRGFATTFAPGILPSLLEQLPALRDLHLRDCHVMALHGELPSHNLQRIRLDSSHEYASAHFARVLTICADSVHDLDVRFIGGLQLRAPCFLSESPYGRPVGGSSIRTLRLDNISVLAHLSSGYAHLLRDLPALEHLHLSHHAPFAAGAFAMLPSSLRSLTASAYYGLWTPEPAKNGFVAALAGCIGISTKEIARAEGSGGKKWDERLDLGPVVEACRTERIPCKKVEEPDPFVTIFFGTKVPCAEARKEIKVNSEEEDEDADDEASFQDVLAAIPTRISKLPVSSDSHFW